jgi:hypothetical protein
MPRSDRDYCLLPDRCGDEPFPAAFERIVAWLGLPFDDHLRARVEVRCGFDARGPQTPFTRAAAASAPGVDVGPLRRLFEQLEERRLMSDSLSRR